MVSSPVACYRNSDIYIQNWVNQTLTLRLFLKAHQLRVCETGKMLAAAAAYSQQASAWGVSIELSDTSILHTQKKRTSTFKWEISQNFYIHILYTHFIYTILCMIKKSCRWVRPNKTTNFQLLTLTKGLGGLLTRSFSKHPCLAHLAKRWLSGKFLKSLIY